MLNYFENVLGLRSIILKPDITQQPSTELVLLIICAQDLSPEARSLLEKMIQALKIDEKDYQLVYENNLPLDVKPMSILSFSSSLENQLHTKYPESFIVETNSPAEILKNQQLKRKVWEDMQRVMNFIKEKID